MYFQTKVFRGSWWVGSFFLDTMLTSCGWNDKEAVSLTCGTAPHNTDGAAAAANDDAEPPTVLAVFITKTGGRVAHNITPASVLELAYASLDVGLGRVSFGSECTRAADIASVLTQRLSCSCVIATCDELSLSFCHVQLVKMEFSPRLVLINESIDDNIRTQIIALCLLSHFKCMFHRVQMMEMNT